MQRVFLSALVAAASLVTSLHVLAQDAIPAGSKTERISSIMATMADPSAARLSVLSAPEMPETKLIGIGAANELTIVPVVGSI